MSFDFFLHINLIETTHQSSFLGSVFQNSSFSIRPFYFSFIVIYSLNDFLRLIFKSQLQSIHFSGWGVTKGFFCLVFCLFVLVRKDKKKVGGITMHSDNIQISFLNHWWFQVKVKISLSFLLIISLPLDFE